MTAVCPMRLCPNAEQIAVENLPDDVILYLLPSRYCEIDRMMDLAWSLFANTPTGWARVQAIVDYVHNHVTFGYQFAAPTKSARTTSTLNAVACARDFCASGGDTVPLHEYPGALLHRAISVISACRF